MGTNKGLLPVPISLIKLAGATIRIHNNQKENRKNILEFTHPESDR